MRRILNILFIIGSLLIAEDKSTYLWDLGVKIGDKAAPQQKLVKENGNSGKQASLSNRMVKPQKIKAELKSTNFLPKNSPMENLSDLEKLKFGEQYFFLGQYLSTIKYLEKIDFNAIGEIEKKKLIYYYSDALYNLGKYERVVGILSESSDMTKTDEMLFLLGMSSLKCNDKKNAVYAFDELVKNYPESEYSFLANLQSRAIKRR